MAQDLEGMMAEVGDVAKCDCEWFMGSCLPQGHVHSSSGSAVALDDCTKSPLVPQWALISDSVSAYLAYC